MKKRFGALVAIISRNAYVLAAALLVLGILAVYFVNRNGEELQTMVVERGEFLQEVSVSGKVVAAQEVDLAFSETGRVEVLNVAVGDRVGSGATLATLAINVLLSDLRTAEQNLARVEREQDALVESAYRNLLSKDLSAVPSSSYGVTSPVITGRYEGGEGTYRIRITQKENSADFELRVFNLEFVEPVVVFEDEPTPLGTQGLFISFPDALSYYEDTTWEITIPNTKSASYLSNTNAYQEAQRARERSITSAQSSVENIRAEIAERVLRAPFAGIVTVVDTEVGATAAVNEPVISLIGDDTLQVESFVPEINLAFVQPGASSTVTLDAYGATVPFEAVVISVDPAETVRDGVSTYRAILRFVEDDERVRSGMTANVRITADRRDNVISVPQGAVESREGKKFVTILVGKEVVEREVETGIVSSIGSIEIVSGLEEGDVLVLP
jgi:multidrug efflux pump subunit AcrA (membrane-fusion protein)